MKIGLIGYGNMGKMVEQIAVSKGHSIAAIIDSKSSNLDALKAADICIDFTHPHCVLQNIKNVASLGKNLVVGTTGWYEQLDEAIHLAKNANIGLLYAPNFSLGITLFLNIIAHAAKVIAPYQAYDVSGIEIHHNKKADIPSGTAKAITDHLHKHISREDHEIHFASVRVGAAPGTHSVIFDSPADTITLTHTARNREGLAEGAIYAAKWLLGKQGVFTLDDILRSNS